MTPKFYRVHGCKRCKERKIKCDQKTPCCSQCKRLGKPCPGSSSGPIYFHAQATASHNRSPRTSPSSSRSSRSPPSNPSTTLQPIAQLTTHNIPYAPPSPKEQGLLAQLAIRVGSHHQAPWLQYPWFFRLASLSLPQNVQHAFLLPLTATVESFRALHTGDDALGTAAFSRYMKATSQQRLQVAQLLHNDGPVDQELVLYRVIMALLLLEFAISAPASLPRKLVEQEAAMIHARGALNLLRLVGPVRCQSSPFFDMFWHLRFIMSGLLAISPEPCILGTPEWIRIPFLHRAKTDFDYQIDQILLQCSQPHRQDLPPYADRDFSALAAIKQAIGQGPLVPHFAPHYERVEDSSHESQDMIACKKLSNILNSTSVLMSGALPELSLEAVVQVTTAAIQESEELAIMSIDSFRAVEQAILALNMIRNRGPSDHCRQQAQQAMARVCAYIRVRSEPKPLCAQLPNKCRCAISQALSINN